MACPLSFISPQSFKDERTKDGVAAYVGVSASIIIIQSVRGTGNIFPEILSYGKVIV